MATDPIDDILSNRGNREQWGAILSNLANMIQGIPRAQADIETRKAQAFANQMLGEEREQQVAAKRQQLADMKAIDVVFSSGDPAQRDAFLKNVPGHLRTTIAKHLSELDEIDSKRRDFKEKARIAADDTVARALATLPTYNYDPKVAQGVLSTLKGYYQDDPERSKEIANIEAQLQANPTPEFVKQTVDALITRSGTQRKAEEAAAKAKQEAEKIKEEQEHPKPVTVSPGAALVDPKTGKPIFTAPAAQAPNRPVTVSPGATLVDPATGKVIFTAPSKATDKPPTGAQNRALGFFNNAKQAHEDLEKLEPTIAGLGFFGQERLKHAHEVLQTSEGQQYNQAKRAFLEAYLRKVSGATVRPDEYATAENTFFVQPGNGPELIEQKRRARAAILASIAQEAGPSALNAFYGEEGDSIIQSYRERAKGATDIELPANGKPQKSQGRWDRSKNPF